ncbi:unnamed protein product [Effrenium voratum]|nr:unnamed protein product [Effrenium voratum]CAJ1435370.1 unnamed protein product [Effrenium voratum]
MSAQQFLQLQEDIAQDRSGNMEAIPQTPEDLLTETCITNRGIFEEAERPETRQELQEIRARFKNNMEIAAHFFGDRYLQLEFRMIYLVWRAVLRAEEIVYNEPDSLPAATLASLRKCLYEMAWNRQQLSREAYAVCENGQWKATDGDVRALSFALFARPMNTKMYLEDMFGHVSSTIKWTKYFYMRATPSFKQAKFPVVETTFQDFLAAKAPVTAKTVQQEKQAVGKVRLPEQLKLSRSVVEQKFKAAGPGGNHLSAAATAWLVTNYSSNFAGAELAWTGVFFVKGLLYVSSRTNRVTLSLGFRSYAALGVPLTAHKYKEKDSDPCDGLSSRTRKFKKIVWSKRVANLVKPAIKAGVYLTVPQLSAVQKQVKYLLPAEGSGAHGALIKIDYATAIVKHYFADLSPDSPEFQAMVSAIMGGSKPKVRCPKEVLIALKSLSAEEREGFEELEQVVANQEKTQEGVTESSERRPSEKVDAYIHLQSTHPAIRKLVPNFPGYGCNRNPTMKRYYAWIPCASVRRTCSRTFSAVCNSGWCLRMRVAFCLRLCERVPECCGCCSRLFSLWSC